MARGSRPSIVRLLTDHHVFAHHYTRPGPRPVLPTYERLGREGVSFSRDYSVRPLCTPARASMLTGLYPHRHETLMNNGPVRITITDFADPGHPKAIGKAEFPGAIVFLLGVDYNRRSAAVSPAGADVSVEHGSGSRDMPGLAPSVR